MVSVRPAFVVVPDHTRTDLRPLQRILRRVDPVGLDGALILNGDAQPEEGLHAVVQQRLHQQVCVGEIIGSGVLRVCVEIPEQVGDIHPASAAIHALHIMESGKRASEGLQIFEFGKIHTGKGGLSYAVERFDLPRRGHIGTDDRHIVSPFILHSNLLILPVL